jgi:hypothetical protein
VTEIHGDIRREAARLLGLAGGEGVPLRLLGGIAIRLRCPETLPEAFDREYKDIDFMAPKGKSGEAQTFLARAGYDPHKAFNALNGQERLLFFDDAHGRQVDVFIGSFSMSHKVPVGDRITLEPGTIPLAELLLTKLQIAELNEKDVRDTLALLHSHEIAEHDGDVLNAARVAELCAGDWGLWRTITGNLAETRDRIGNYALGEADEELLRGRIDALLERIEREPKSRAWRLRAKIGERKRWYELPEEVAGGP